MLFLNISTDFVQITNEHAEDFVFRNEVDQKLGPLLVSWWRKYDFTRILLINGPGGFTNLRVGALVLNLLKTLHPKIEIYEMSKIDLFDFAVKQKILPSL
ncbi:MAG: hypothetical protein GXP45_03255 [bacterium]|nr:hypothetical protein [bacterium]